jgi:Protein of unknown function (DUF732)
MVHHGLAPGQTGNQAQRRLYVDLIAFPDGQVPRIAPSAPAAALAEAVLYFGDPNLPSQPDQAFLALVRKVGSSFSGLRDPAVLADGSLACAGLSRKESTDQIGAVLERRGLTLFDSYLVAIFATSYLCPQNGARALGDLQQALTAGS